MKDYKRTRLKLTFLYFGIIFLIVMFFSFIILQIQQSQFSRFGTVRDNLRVNPLPNRIDVPREIQIEIDKKADERALEISQAIDESKRNFLINLILLDIVILCSAGILSIYMSQQTMKPLLQALEKQKKFVADASHELKTPISAMRSETDVILRSKIATEQDYKEVLISVQEELESLSGLANNLLDIAKSDVLQSQLPDEVVNLKEVVDHEVALLKRNAEIQEVMIHINIEEGINIKGKKYRLEQLFRILIDNAIKYNTKGGNITITAQQNNKNFIIEVGDTGVGISKAHIDQIFNRFYRVSEDRNHKGFGLGLSIAQQIVHEHHGNIQVKSVESEGTVFTIELPL